MSDEFPAEIAQFIDQNIESLAQLEAILLLRGEPTRSWTTEDVAKALYITPEMAGPLLADMSRTGFAKSSPSGQPHSYSYGLTGQMDELAGRLASVYQERRVAVISLIYSKPMNKVQTFADAFRLRREDPQ
jgi:hypothetical protein